MREQRPDPKDSVGGGRRVGGNATSADLPRLQLGDAGKGEVTRLQRPSVEWRLMYVVYVIAM
jgi:hypothetical protein